VPVKKRKLCSLGFKREKKKKGAPESYVGRAEEGVSVCPLERSGTWVKKKITSSRGKKRGVSFSRKKGKPERKKTFILSYSFISRGKGCLVHIKTGERTPGRRGGGENLNRRKGIGLMPL